MTPDAQRKRRLAIFGGVLVVAVVIVAAASGGGGDKTSTSAAVPKGPRLKGVSAIRAEFAGIPQKSNVLGNPKAQATLMVFADLQCPFCAQFENKAFATLVKRYVRPGKLKVVFQPIVIIGQDSILGARAAASAGQQGKLFQYVATLYRNQGEENSGYLNTTYVRKIARGVPGLDAAKLVAQLKAAPVNKLLNAAQTIATSGHVDATPTFFAGKTGATLRPLPVTSLSASAFTKALDGLTA